MSIKEIVDGENQEQQYQHLLLQNDSLYQIKAQRIISDIQARLQDCQALSKLSGVSLSASSNYLQNVLKRKKEGELLTAQQEEQMDRQILRQVTAQNNKLIEEIIRIQDQIVSIKSKTQKIQLAQKNSSRHIIQIQDRIFQKKKKWFPAGGNNAGSRAAFNFAYQLKEGKVIFNQTYLSIIKHLYSRIQDNRQILVSQQKALKKMVQEQSSLLLKLRDNKKLRNEYKQTLANIQQFEKQGKQMQAKIERLFKEKSSQVERKLPQSISQSIKGTLRKRSNYQQAYLLLIKVLKKVVDEADIKKISDYIGKQ